MQKRIENKVSMVHCFMSINQCYCYYFSLAQNTLSHSNIVCRVHSSNRAAIAKRIFMRKICKHRKMSFAIIHSVIYSVSNTWLAHNCNYLWIIDIHPQQQIRYSKSFNNTSWSRAHSLGLCVIRVRLSCFLWNLLSELNLLYYHIQCFVFSLCI